MRSKFGSEYGAPARKNWLSARRRGTRTSIGPKISLAAIVVVGGVIGIRGVVQDAPTHLPKMSLSSFDATRASSTAAAVPLPARRASTTGQGTISPPRPAPEPSQPRTSVAAVEPPEVAEAEAEAPAAKTAPAEAAEKPNVVKKKIVRVEHTSSRVKRSTGTAQPPAQTGAFNL